jgi:hypothetical protein
MRHKLTFSTGFAAGYLLGARAGRERYEQLVRLGREVADNPAVQATAGLAQAQAATLVSSVARRAKQALTSTVGGRVMADHAAPYPDSYPAPAAGRH